jgi:hypothetical protein
MDMHLTGVHLMGIQFIRMHLIGMHLTDMCPRGVYLTGVHLMGVYLITLFRGCTITGDIAGSSPQVCGQNGSATLLARAADSSCKLSSLVYAQALISNR